MAKKELENLASMSLGDHLEELRTRLMLSIGGILIGLVISLFFGSYLMSVISMPLEVAIEKVETNISLQAIEPSEKFMVYIKTCLVFGILITAPWVSYQIWSFVSAGLYKHEKKYIHVVAPISAILFITGAVFFIIVVAPMTMIFFSAFDTGIDFVEVNFTLKSYTSFVLSLTLIFGLAFQMPIAIVFAERMHLVTVQALVKARKFVILGLAIVSAIVTPPDVISQIALATPLYILYEGSIVVCRIMNAKKK